MKKWFAVAIPVLIAAAVIAICANVASRVQSTMGQQTHLRHIVIDAGHGGEDGGAVSKNGVLESRVNLEIALRMRELCAFCGLAPVMVRTTDTAVYSQGCQTIAEKKVSDLHNRAKLVQATDDPILISIHENYFPQTQYFGAQVFFAPSDGSCDFAELVQNALRSAVDPQNDRKIKPAQSVYLMQQIQCPGILVECGFLSNTDECQKLTNPDYQKKLTFAVCSGLMQYLTNEERENEV